jgi:Fe-S cluster biogenesis protein NfuA
MSNAEEIKKKVEEEIAKIRPRLQADGGDIKLVGIEDNVVKVELEGACKGCPMSSVTLSMGVERAIKKAIPEIKSVEAVNANFPPGIMERFREIGKG